MNLIALGDCFGAHRLYSNMFRETHIIRTVTGIDEINRGDVVMFGGGEDISPSLYKEKRHPITHAPDKPSQRDTFEFLAFQRAQESGASCYGICRGAQLLCALSGGKLVQHVNNHAGGHFITTSDGEKMMTSSVHHQMMWPFNLPKDKFEILGVSEEPLSTIYIFSPEKSLNKVSTEPEIVFFPETRSLGIQGHPEFMHERSQLVQHSRKLLQHYLMKGEK